ncbi:hypothetical protein ACLB2K_058998 [Fragaria x ananassa]
MDRISNLPEPLMEKILFALPSKDSIRMSFSSKQWQSLWYSRWNSIPITSIDFENWSFTGKRRPRNKFVALVDDSLRRNLPEHEDQKKIVEFRLAIVTLSRKMKDSDVVDRWTKMVTRNYVRVLRLLIDFAPKIRYEFPLLLLMLELELMHCSLDGKAFIEEHTVFVRLKTLILNHVYFNEVAVGELLIKCPLLETLELYFCGNIKHVELCDFPNLKKVELWNANSFTYKIDSPYLESLLYFEDGKPMDIEAVSCNNLRKLDVVAHGSTLTDQYINKEVCSKFSFLGDLLFNAQSFGSKDVDQIRIFGKFTACDRLRFRIHHRIKRIVKFSFEELQELKLPPVARVIRELVLRGVPSLRDYTAFADGLLWSGRPLTISVQLQAYDSPNRKFIKFLYRMLMDREEDPLCCRECRIKCWRHCLFSARITKSSCDSENGRADDEDVEEEDNKVEDREKDEEKDEDEEEGEGEGEVMQVQVGDGEGVGVGGEEEVGVGEGVDEDGDGDDDDDAELFKTLRRLEKNFVFELQWSTLEDHGELVGLELGFSRD